MKLRHTLCATLAALLPLCTLTLAPTAVHAQQSARDSQAAPTPATATTAPRTARYCTNCATVEAVRVVDASGEGKAAAAMGSGSGRTAATAAGTAEGAAGRKPEPNARPGQRYEVVVRYASNGSAQTLQYDNDPGFRAGDAVRVNNGVLSRDR